MSDGFLSGNNQDTEDHWVSVSDLMAALMMIFLLVAIIYMVRVEHEKDKIKEVAILYSHLKKQLYQDLYEEFSKDFTRWGAELHQDLTIRFKEPSILFSVGSRMLKPKFKKILANFFPRYVAILTSDKYKSSITEIRIEGHTSSMWRKNTSSEDAYFLNMKLSQERTRSTLRYVLSLQAIQPDINWLRKYMTANGLSSSRLIYFPNGQEDALSSQRVEFRIINNAEARIAKILELN